MIIYFYLESAKSFFKNFSCPKCNAAAIGVVPRDLTTELQRRSSPYFPWVGAKFGTSCHFPFIQGMVIALNLRMSRWIGLRIWQFMCLKLLLLLLLGTFSFLKACFLDPNLAGQIMQWLLLKATSPWKNRAGGNKFLNFS